MLEAMAIACYTTLVGFAAADRGEYFPLVERLTPGNGGGKAVSQSPLTLRQIEGADVCYWHFATLTRRSTGEFPDSARCLLFSSSGIAPAR